MAKEIKLPKLGKTMQEAIIVECLVKIGDKINIDDYLFELETDKVTLEMESPLAGFVKAIIAEPGQKLTVGQTLLIVGAEDEEVDTKITSQTSSQKKNCQCKQKANRITNADLIEAIKESTVNDTAYKLGQKIPISRLGKITAQQMLQSKHETPCFYLNINADVTELVEYKNGLNNPKIAFDDFLIKALAKSLLQWPVMTGTLEQNGNDRKLADTISIALAIDTEAGQVAIVIKNADKKDITEIAKCRKSLTDKAETANLSADNIEGA